MRGVLRVLGRLALWLLVLVAGFAAAVFLAVLVSAEDSEQLVGAIVLLAVALLVAAAAVWAAPHAAAVAGEGRFLARARRGARAAARRGAARPATEPAPLGRAARRRYRADRRLRLGVRG